MAVRQLYYILFLFTLQSFAQEIILFHNDSINRIDSKNNKVGFWKLYDLKRNITVSGEVKNNEKFDEVNYFIEGKIFATQRQDSIILFYNNGQRINAKLSWKNKDNPLVLGNGEPIDNEIKNRFLQIAELPVMYYGGELAMAKYIRNNLSSGFNETGRVVVDVIINKDGKIEKPMIFSSDNPRLNNEALRLIKKMPRWQPGFQSGYFVRTQMHIPLNF